jgi:hypothetical protein
MTKNLQSRSYRMLTCLMAVLALLSTAEEGWTGLDQPPEKGGLTYQLGMPPVYKGRSGFEVGWQRPARDGSLSAFYNLGVSRDIGSPVVGVAGWRLEGYLGLSDQDFDGGGRALFEIPSFRFGLGVDFNGREDEVDPIYMFDLPVKRGGLFGRGTTLALRWIPTRDQTFSVGVNVPLWGRNIGATRPDRDHVVLVKRKPARLQEAETHTTPELNAVLAQVRDTARGITLLSQPFGECPGGDPAEAMGPTLSRLTKYMADGDRTLNGEIQAFHLALDQAFTLAVGGDGLLGAAISLEGRQILLEEVLIPYNSYLGQRKTNDSLVGMAAVAQARFAAHLLADKGLASEDARSAYYVFQTLCDILDDQRRDLREQWGDSRFVWLPLQYALTPDQHDSQQELDELLSLATDQDFTRENRVWYVINEEFQWEMARSVRRAQDYHVLWIHDFRGKNGQGEPDAVAFAHTINYLEALIESVEALDERGKLPKYFLFLDQHYFEINKSRYFLRLLHDPMGYKLSLPDDKAEWQLKLQDTQDRLRQAVDASLLLQIRASQYGPKWLTNQIKVHINITNPVDHSFISWHSAGIFPVPDNLMRDHRKIAFYDVTEADPYRGLAMFTGMGIGEHYVGASWEDRAIMIQGPGALAVKDAARELLTAQGYEPEEIPFTLRKLDKPVDYADMLAEEKAARTPDWLEDRGGVLQLHNETGFHDKPINVAKALQYSLMPAGSVLEVPDSLWQNYVYASLLSGSALRGCRVMIIAPTQDTAPSADGVTMARSHGMLARLIVFSQAMEDQLEAEGGLLKVGLYNPRQGVADLAGRFTQGHGNMESWSRKVYPDNPAVSSVIANIEALLDSLGYEVTYLLGDEEGAQPKIHLKANFMASKLAWEKLCTARGGDDLVRDYIAYLAESSAVENGKDSSPNLRQGPERLLKSWEVVIKNLLDDLSPGEESELIYYLTVGSTNMDYRSMVMDGEVQVILGGWQSLTGFLDFLLIPGLCDWVETTEELDALLPPPGGLTRKLAGLMKLAL